MTRALSDDESRDQCKVYGYPPERSEAEWVTHLSAHREAYAALYAVVIRGWGLNRVTHVMHPFYSVPPHVEDWVTYPRKPTQRGGV